nr:protein BPS1, chloroplastic-like [Arachis hypogaea]
MVNRSDSFKGYSRRSIESLPGKSGPGGVSRGVLQRCDGQILICGGGVRGELMLDRQDTDTGTLRHKIVFDRGDMDIDVVFRDTELVSVCVPFQQYCMRFFSAVLSAFLCGSFVCVFLWQFHLHFLPIIPSVLPFDSFVCAFFRQFRLHPFYQFMHNTINRKNNYPSLDGWKKHIDSRNPRIEKCDGILDNLVGSLDLPKVEKSPKGKVMMQAMYGVKVQIVFVYSVFAAAFLGSTKKLIDLDVAEIYTWVPEFKSLQNLVNEEVRVRFSSGRFPVLKELEAVDSVIKELYPIILNVVEPIETELDLKTVEQLGRATEKLSKGLDLLAKGVNGFFQVVLSGRDALLSNLRSGGIVYGRGSGGNIGVQAIN